MKKASLTSLIGKRAMSNPLVAQLLLSYVEAAQSILRDPTSTPRRIAFAKSALKDAERYQKELLQYQPSIKPTTTASGRMETKTPRRPGSNPGPTRRRESTFTPRAWAAG